MQFALSSAVTAVSDATGLRHGFVEAIAAQLQQDGALPRSPGGRLPAVVDLGDCALIILATLIDRPRVEAARLACEVAGYRHQTETAGDYLARLLHAAGAADHMAPESVVAAKASVTVAGGDAVLFRFSCADGPMEEVFTAGGRPWTPDHCAVIIAARTLPGRLLHRIGRALAGLAL